MKIEVTEKEAQGILENRYIKVSGKKPFWFCTGFVVVALFAFFAVEYYVSSWIGVGAYCVIACPSLWISLRFSKKAKVYARGIINEKGENI